MADETPEPTPKKRRRDKEVLPFAEDAEKLDGRAWNRKPLLLLGAILLVVAVVVAIVLAGKDLASDGDDGGGGTVPLPIQTTTTTEATTTTTSTTSTTTPTTTTGFPLQAGMVCTPIPEIPDCIDPEGDGRYNLITDGADCLATATDPMSCADNDGDGDAGPAVTPS